MNIKPVPVASEAHAARSLNQACFCIGLDQGALARALHSEPHQADLAALLRERCPHLFSAHPIFLAPSHLAAMRQLIAAIESVVALPAWRERVLADAPAIAAQAPGGATGVFFGYDFHVSGSGIALIEINSNAGGAMLNAVQARAHRACCPPVEESLPPLASAEAIEAGILAMFAREWARSGRDRPLRSIAIVDQAPAGQYLYPEFLLFQRLFERHGLQVVLADPGELRLRDGRLYHGALAIDLVYNRLTDFYLQQDDSAQLRQAWLQQAVVLTPHPPAHALYAHKRNLALLGDAAWLRSAGVPRATRDVLLAGIPHTEQVQAANAERLWQQRAQLFFKPAAGFGSRAAYRGDKLTRRVWQQILAGDYVAQALVPPGTRVVSTPSPGTALKFDVRAYVYDGQLQSRAARLYQGQTTNFRTPGGGFAPVHLAASAACPGRIAQGADAELVSSIDG
jgi:hypothetical protein